MSLQIGDRVLVKAVRHRGDVVPVSPKQWAEFQGYIDATFTHGKVRFPNVIELAIVEVEVDLDHERGTPLHHAQDMTVEAGGGGEIELRFPVDKRGIPEGHEAIMRYTDPVKAHADAMRLAQLAADAMRVPSRRRR